jgi:hypothetical protein
MDAYGNATREERLRHIAATLARAYSAEPLNLPETMKAQVRRLKQEAPPKPAKEVSPG